MRYRFIDAHKKAWPVTLMCGVLNVSRSGYYHWSARGPSRQALSNGKLDQRVREIFTRHKQRYGAPRITDDLHDEGFGCSENRVARRMRALGLRAVQADIQSHDRLEPLQAGGAGPDRAGLPR